MYEILLKWGMDNLASFTKVKANHEHSITLEAIKVKNSLVLKRFDIAWKAHQELVDLVIDLEDKLDGFKVNARETDNTLAGAKKFVGDLSRDLHPLAYRKYRKIRSQFDGVNDLFSAYTQEISEFVHISTLKKIYKEKEIYNRSSIIRIYRGLWTKIVEIIASIIRVSSSDLRFWLTDNPSISYATQWSKKDVSALWKFVLADNWHEDHYRLSLESPKGLKEYWDGWEEYCQEKSSAK
jgi:hypothetical protein